MVAGARELWVAVLLIGLAAAAHQAFSANLYTFPSDVLPRSAVASVVGIGGMMGGCGGMLFTKFVGQILQVTGSYRILFIMADRLPAGTAGDSNIEPETAARDTGPGMKPALRLSRRQFGRPNPGGRLGVPRLAALRSRLITAATTAFPAWATQLGSDLEQMATRLGAHLKPWSVRAGLPARRPSGMSVASPWPPRPSSRQSIIWHSRAAVRSCSRARRLCQRNDRSAQSHPAKN